MASSFFNRLLPAPKNGGFRMKDYWVWCGSVIRGEDGAYHMFASRWPKALSFSPHWLTNSEVVRAVSKTPEGPYEFQEVVLPTRGPECWDGRMTHNPTIHKSADMYLLYYTGTTYTGPTPTPEHSLHQMPDMRLEARANQRVGLATSKSVFGPWTRRDSPILPPAPGQWDGMMTTNPAPCVLESGSILLVYKAVGSQTDLLRLGVAKARHYEGPYVRLTDRPIFNFDATGDHVEDAYVWRSGAGFELLMKDMKGGICGEKGAGIHATSSDGIHWTISDPPLAYSRTIRWDDGTASTHGNLERPQVLIQGGKPTHLFCATCVNIEGTGRAVDTWNMVFPLRS
ncbi:MAG: glycoside hydrolase family protein [Candidatus Sumerlaeota bacterium]|nr:glycoside hydrolase family protein [Candidatus Sumerlaeota bacterium]